MNCFEIAEIEKALFLPEGLFTSFKAKSYFLINSPK